MFSNKRESQREIEVIVGWMNNGHNLLKILIFFYRNNISTICNTTFFKKSKIISLNDSLSYKQ